MSLHIPTPRTKIEHNSNTVQQKVLEALGFVLVIHNYICLDESVRREMKLFFHGSMQSGNEKLQTLEL